MILLRNIGIASAIVITVIALFSIVGYTDKVSCPDGTQTFLKYLEATCPDEYLEQGHDSVQECMNYEIERHNLEECIEIESGLNEL